MDGGTQAHGQHNFKLTSMHCCCFNCCRCIVLRFILFSFKSLQTVAIWPVNSVQSIIITIIDIHIQLHSLFGYTQLNAMYINILLVFLPFVFIQLNSTIFKMRCKKRTKRDFYRRQYNSSYNWSKYRRQQRTDISYRI